VKLSLPTKIFLAFGLTVSIFAALAVYSLKTFRNLGEDLGNIVAGHLILARVTGQLETHQQNRFRDLHRSLDENDLENRVRILKTSSAYHPKMIRARIEEAHSLCQRQIARLQRADRAERPQEFAAKQQFYSSVSQQIKGIEKTHIQLNGLTETLTQFAQTSTQSLSVHRYQLQEIENTLRAAIYQLNKSIDEQTERAVSRVRRNEEATLWRVVSITALALLLGILLAVWSSRALAPIHQLVDFARAISRGDYQRSVTIRGDDELSALADELRLMAQGRQKREEELDRQQDELERAYHRVADLKRYHESVVESLRTAIIVTDRELKITSANRAVEACFQLNRNEILGKDLETITLGAKIAELSGELSALLETDEVKNIHALALNERLYDAAIVPLRSDEEEVIGLVVATEDVTSAVQTKEALIRSERLATIGRMSAHVTHEIRNPLSSIGLNAEILGTLSADDELQAQKLRQAIIREVDRLTAITEAYLNFARLPQPILQLEAPLQLLESIASFVEHDCAAAKVKITVHKNDNCDAINVDTNQIRQALLNLVRNAKESMPEGGLINLSARQVQNEVILCVEDQGVGIEQEEIDRIFDPFYSTKQTGTGLGLALVQQIIQEHGGRLAVSSQPDQGTRFELIFPI
jgi:PAS domain S-box-containing protein